MARQTKGHGKAGRGDHLGTEAARWQRLVAEQEESQLSQEEYCREQGVSPHVFRDWKYRRLAKAKAALPRLRKEDGTASALAPVRAPEFVPVQVVFDQPPGDSGGGRRPSCEDVGPGSGVEVLLPGGLRIGLQSGFDASVLRQVVEVLGC